ncbi:MAG: polysaccharide deacetylase family protein, partial [Nitrososphaeraceae archaeon]
INLIVKLVFVTSLLGPPMILVAEAHINNNNNSNSQPVISQVANTSSSNDAGAPTKLAIITFDDGYKSQFTSAKPILAHYGYKSSFFIFCNFVGKTAEEMNSSSIVNFVGKGVEQMSWQDIMALYKHGNQIGAHTMNHLRNLTSMSNSELDYEIGQSKECLVDHGISTTTFAYPYENGKDNSTIVEKISKYYSYARAGSYPLMFLHCDHYKAHPQVDCRTYLPNGKVSVANRYSIIGWSHDSDRRKYSYNDSQMLDRFIEVVNSQKQYNKVLPGQAVEEGAVEAIPIIVYHRIDNSGAQYSTNVSLFAEEMKYLHDNGFKVISLIDLVYDNATNSFYLKNS